MSNRRQAHTHTHKKKGVSNIKMEESHPFQERNPNRRPQSDEERSKGATKSSGGVKKEPTREAGATILMARKRREEAEDDSCGQRVRRLPAPRLSPFCPVQRRPPRRTSPSEIIGSFQCLWDSSFFSLITRLSVVGLVVYITTKA